MEKISDNEIIIIDNKYISKEILGKGKYGKVYLAEEIKIGNNKNEKGENKKFAIKVLKKKDEKFTNKIKYIKMICISPYIIKRIDDGEGEIKIKGKSKGKRQYIVYEYCQKKSLIEYLLFPNLSFLEEKYAKIMFKYILRGIQNMHNKKICHRDIKLDNILLDGKFIPKIGDFSFIIRIMEGLKLKNRCGTKAYAAPEILRTEGYNGYDGLKADIFSLGITLLRLVTGKQEIITIDEFIQYKENFDYISFLKNIKILIKDTSEEFQHLILKMIDFYPDERPTIDQILEYKWLKDVKEDNLNQQKLIYTEFKKREENLNLNENNYTINLDSSESEYSRTNGNKSPGNNDINYFEEDFIIKYIDDSDLCMRNYLKINGYLNPVNFMNLIANKIKNKIDNCYIDPSKTYFKFNVVFEHEDEDENDDMEEEKENIFENEEKDIYKLGIKEKDLKVQIILLKSNKGYYLLQFYKKSGNREEYYEKLDNIISIIKNSKLN